MTPCLVAIDVGNSRIKIGCFPHVTTPSPPPASELPVCLGAVAIPTSATPDWPQLCNALPLGEHNPPVAAVIAGANPPVIARIKQHWPDTWPTLVQLTVPQELPLEIDLPDPTRVGIDRLLNAVAVRRLCADGQAAIVVDSGTATTVDVVDRFGRFAGGAILPGFDLAARSLHDYTALLPWLKFDELTQTPSPLGRDTQSAMWSGLYFGQVGAVKELLDRLGEQLSSEAHPEPEPLIIVTGGGGELLHHELPHTVWQPNLSLQGLTIAFQTTTDGHPAISGFD